MGEFFTSIFKAREARNALLLVIAGVVFLAALEVRQQELSLLAEREEANKITQAQAANISRARVRKPMAMSQDRQSIRHDESVGRKPDFYQIKRFLLSAVHWVISALLAIRFGHFGFIKKIGRVILLLLFVATVLLGLIGSGLLTVVLRSMGVSEVRRTVGWILGSTLLAAGIGLIKIILSKPKPRRPVAMEPTHQSVNHICRPRIKFRDIGGLDNLKSQIRRLVETRLNPKSYRKYGVVQNGILLYGPKGTGKTFLAEATAGEFDLNYFCLSSTSMLEMWIGGTGANLRNAFASAASCRPVLLFIDELDTVGASRRNTSNDLGGARQEFNNQVIQLMQCIDQYGNAPGFVLMAATHVLDSLDPALIREGRFDLKVRVDLPDQPTREKILESQLSGRPWKRFDLRAIATKTPGFSAAKLGALVDRAAVIAANNRRKIETQDLSQALAEMGGQDRPLFQRVDWEDVIVEPELEQDLKELVSLLNGSAVADRWKIRPPTGVLLIGPPGTGKSLLALLIATQTERSFYPISASDILGGNVGDSVKKLRAIFERAKENAPSIIFFDEIDGLLPDISSTFMSLHDAQLLDETLTQISLLSTANKVFLVGTCNQLDRIDPRALRGGRLSEKIRIGLPGQTSRR
jgi:transitional endoplasmic reticulum ATPase